MTRIPIIFFFVCTSMQAQDADAYKKIYLKTYLETSQKNFNQALKTADSLYTISETPYFQTKSLMLSATLYQQSGDIKKSVKYALQSENIIEKTDDPVWKAKVYGFLSTQYRILKLYHQSGKYSEKAFDISKTIKDPELANSTLGLMMQEMGYSAIEQKNYKGAIEKIAKSQQYFNLINSNKDFFTANNEQLLGLSYYHLKDFENALLHYQKALEDCRDVPENFLTGLIYSGLASVYIEKRDLGNAKKYLSYAQNISDKSEYLQLKNEVYEISQKYYVLTQNLKKFIEIQKKKETVVDKISEKSNAFINESYSSLDEKNKVIQHTNFVQNIIILIGGLLLITGVLGFVFYRREQKNKFRKILKDFDKREEDKQGNMTVFSIPVLHKVSIADDLGSVKPDEYGMMTEATEKKLLMKLQEFEKSDLFTNNGISLSSLSTFCETNTKYLSYVINTYKHKDFNNYINELRVNYVIDKLRNTPKYRRYKIAVLAEEAGFSSQNKFATIFKKTTSISPSVFIKYLEEEIAKAG